MTTQEGLSFPRTKKKGKERGEEEKEFLFFSIQQPFHGWGGMRLR